MMEINGSSRRRFGPYEVDLHTRELWKHGIKVKLVGQPFEILALMVQRPGQLVTREELRAQLWPGDTFVDFNHGLNAAVNKLRDALCDSADDPKYIETLPRRGYRFAAAVEKVVSPEATSSSTAKSDGTSKLASEPAIGTVEPADAAVHLAQPLTTIFQNERSFSEEPKRRWWLRRSVLIPVAVLVLLVSVGIVADFHDYLRQVAKLAAERRVGSQPNPLTDLSDPTSDPAFSPDGVHVAFVRRSFVPGTAGIYVKPVRGQGLRQVTQGEDDCCPAWSPDGSKLVFSRFVEHERTIYEVSAQGGELRKLFSSNVVDRHGELDWSPDGSTIAFVGEAGGGRSSIYLLSLDNLTFHAVTMPKGTDRDWGPVFSPDGERIAFVRFDNTASAGNIVIMPAAGGESQRITSSSGSYLGIPQWSADGQSLIVGATMNGNNGLFRINLDGSGPVLIHDLPVAPWRTAVSKRGFYLAYDQSNAARNIYQLALTPTGQKPRPLIVTVGGENGGPQLSPDGKKLLFFSDRSGAEDLWLSDADGANPVQLTAFGTSGAPRWSPDGKSIVFDVGLGRDWRQPRSVFTLNIETNATRAIVQDQFNNGAPNWSRDGKWIYFPSDRSGKMQLWKVPANGGTPVQITHQEGFAAWEADDGYIYYAKNRYEHPELWRIPLGGGTEVPMYPPIRPETWASWMTVDKGILYVEAGPGTGSTVSFYEFATHNVKHLSWMEKPPFWLGASRDGKSAVFDQPASEESHIMLEESFR